MMRIVILIVVLLLIGLLVKRQIGGLVSEQTESTTIDHESDRPQVPTRPQDVETFKQDVNRYVEDAAEERKKQIDQAVE